MTIAAVASPSLKFLEDRWDSAVAETLDEPELLRYRSNLLGSDLRITNFAGGNTSSKVDELGPLTGQTVKVLWVKGSGGDLGSIKRTGFATLYQEKLLALENLYRGPETEDSMVEMYALCAFRNNPVAASIDTPLHGFLPFAHVDHLHPDWAIALAASANGLAKMEEFNRGSHHRLVWVPWQRPGFELAMMMKRAVEQNPGCNGIVLGGHGLFTWGETQRECYVNTLTVIDQLGQFIERHSLEKGPSRFGGLLINSRPNRKALAVEILPFLRGRISSQRRWIANFSDSEDVLQFVNSRHAKDLSFLGTSCPDHFIRTKIRPMFVPWAEVDNVDALKEQIDESLAEYRAQYRSYYEAYALPGSPALRDTSPSIVLVPGLGMFSFGKNKTEARIGGEFYTNAIHVMEGASLLQEEDAREAATVPQCADGMAPDSFKVFTNYVALPPREAFRIEYWALEDAKIRRQPPEKELSRHIVLVVGGGSGIGREVALLAAARGAHVMVADRNASAAASVVGELAKMTSKEFVAATAVDIGDRNAIERALRATIAAFGGVDILMNTESMRTEDLSANIAANRLLCDEAARIFAAQGLEASIVLTSTANAVAPTRGSETCELSSAALSHLVRELAESQPPRVRVNGICPANVLEETTMFPRDCAEVILFLAGAGSRCISGHLIPMNGGLPEASLP
ncbi:MAG: bifunctional rhamnulose-1-phosphate aldolase/short-chain dehydrogenase [Terracidiphilus sp.]|jgi:rhamnose utilization protein RhaD (predicted bifunctional aldolase and dehydrogenase)/NAD(P)-dependent dehydrogenase (short-subunit alcohol dehydrogenase family)